MKRLNPATGKPFKRGDVREDGYVFREYSKKTKKGKFFCEVWSDPEKVKQRQICKKQQYYNNIEKERERGRLWYKQNSEKKKKREAIWKKQNSDKVNALNAKRRSAKLLRTPKWLTQDQLTEIESFYTKAKDLQTLTGFEYHVDHIIPLQGELVSGLHVPWNLQVITATENLSKHNKHESAVW